MTSSPAAGFLSLAERVSTALQVGRLTQQMEASERSMHNRIQSLEAIRISLEEVRKSALGTFEHS